MIYFVSSTGNDANDGSMDCPFKTPELAVKRLQAGDILYFRGGEYLLNEAIMMHGKGSPLSPIVLSGYRDEVAVFNAININFYKESDKYTFKHETGALFIYRASYIIVRKIKVVNSHGHGIAVRDSDHITIDSCSTENSFCCGISLWDTDSTGTLCSHNKVMNNTVTRATTWDMLPDGMVKGHEPPHEAISIAGACHFEVAFNHVYHCDKEGIDVKENAHHGIVHHNHVHHVDRQGLYADAWFGPLEHVAFYENTVHHCKGAGIVVSVEQGHRVSHVAIYHNQVYDNEGSGILFGTWGANGPRFHIDIFNNEVRNNGHGAPPEGYDYYWITGGLCMLSANITDARIHDNILENNKGFDIGYSDSYLQDGKDIFEVLKEKKIDIYNNIITGNNDGPAIEYPIRTNFENSRLYGYEGC